MTNEEKNRLIRRITLGFGDHHTEAQKKAILAEVNLLAAAVITPAQQAVLDAAEEWLRTIASELRHQAHNAMVFVTQAMVVERENTVT